MIEPYPSADELADAAARAISGTLSDAITVRARATLVATGGRSPGAIYDRLSPTALDWNQVTITLSDERCVGEAHSDSNAGLVRNRLVQGLAAQARFLPLWPAPDPAVLRTLTPFDVVILGMGEDGHVASLIPGDPGLENALTTPDLLRGVPTGLGQPPLARITLTLTAILSARAIFLLISGEAKRGVVARAASGEDLPVTGLIRGAGDRLRIFWTPGA